MKLLVDIWPVKSIATAVFLSHHDSMVAACCLQVRNTVIVAERILLEAGG